MKKGKTPTLISGSSGKPNLITVKAMSQCKRCKLKLAKGTKCFEIPKIGSGFSSKRRHCLKCFGEIINQTKKDLRNLEDLFNEEE
jgi:hypothetical protein